MSQNDTPYRSLNPSSPAALATILDTARAVATVIDHGVDAAEFFAECALPVTLGDLRNFLGY